MEDIKRIIARNIADLRKSKGMTQLDLAEKLNYSDKAISKWERGDSIPDVLVLKTIADLFGVTVDYLLEDEHQVVAPPVENTDDAQPQARKHRFPFRVHAVITVISVLLVWLIATFLFFVFWYALPSSFLGKILPFLYAMPVSAIVWLVFNTIWFSRRKNYLIISIMMWTFLIAIWLTVMLGGLNIWLIFLLGIPGQAIILAWSGMWADMKKKIEDASASRDSASKK